MYKDYIISALGAVLAVKGIPCSASWGPPVLVAAFTGAFIPLLFFCLFCDRCAERWRKRERDARQLEEYIRRLG